MVRTSLRAASIPARTSACACTPASATGAAQLASVWFEAKPACLGNRRYRRAVEATPPAVNAPPLSRRPQKTQQPTEPFFTRPSTEQPYYDISNEAWRERSFAPYPLSAWVEFTFDGVPIRLGEVVQTLAQ